MDALTQQGLFRSEVVNREALRLEGHVLLNRSRLGLWLCLTLLLGVTGLATWVLTAPYARTAVAPGHLVPASGLVQIAAPVFGVVTNLSIAEGDMVSAGARLATILPDRPGPSGDHSVRAGLAALAVREQALHSLLGLGQKEFEANAALSQARMLGLQAELRHLDDSLAQQSALVNLADEDVGRLDTLWQRGTATQTQLQQMRAVVAEHRRDRALVNRDIVRLRTDFDAEHARLAALELARNRRIAEIQIEIAEVEAERAQIRAQGNAIVTAPVAGEVSGLNVVPGGHVRQSETLLQIVPRDAELVAELFMQSHVAGFVTEGQAVSVRLAAFPYQAYGQFDGTVSLVARAAQDPEAIGAPFPFGEPVYRVYVGLDKAAIRKSLPESSLRPGMVLEASLILDRHPVYRWLAGPLLARLEDGL